MRVVDSQGGAASASVTFAVDATSPTITAKDPSPDAFDVTPNATITVRFSEPLNASIGFVALRDAATRAWVPVATRWDDAQTLRLMPANLLREGAVYEVVVNGTAVDRSDPGNPLAASSWRFRVAAYPPFVAVVAPAPGVRWTAGVPQSMRV